MEKIFNDKTEKYMFRYLEKYVGTYRVLAEIDLQTNTFPESDDFEDMYIPCTKNCVIKHTYEGNDILALCFYNSIGAAKNTIKLLKDANIEFESDINDSCVDVYVYFNAKDISEVAKIVKPKTSGKKIHPLSIRNLSKNKTRSNYEIPDTEINKLNKIVDHLDKITKMQFFRKMNKAFLDKTFNKINYKEEMKKDGLTARQFIHSKGYWDKYVKFISNEIKNI